MLFGGNSTLNLGYVEAAYSLGLHLGGKRSVVSMDSVGGKRSTAV
jgi:hypothetical protein